MGHDGGGIATRSEDATMQYAIGVIDCCQWNDGMASMEWASGALLQRTTNYKRRGWPRTGGEMIYNITQLGSYSCIV